MMVYDFQGEVLKALLSAGSLILGEVSCHVIKMLKQSFGETHMQGQDTSCQKPASSCQPREGTTLEAPVKPSGECSPG